MENYILYCYKEWEKSRKGNFLKQLSSLTLVAIILLVLLFGILIAIFVNVLSLDENKDYTVTYILMGIEILLSIILSIYCENFQISHSKTNLKAYGIECVNFQQNISEKYNISVEFIPILIDRFKSKIDIIEKKVEHKRNAVYKFMEMLLIPMSALILGALLDKEISMDVALGIGIFGIILLCFVYGVIIFSLYVYDIAMKFPVSKYTQFVTDLQSILDINEYKIKLDSEDSPAEDESVSESDTIHS